MQTCPKSGGAVPPHFQKWGGSCPPCPPFSYTTATDGYQVQITRGSTTTTVNVAGTSYTAPPLQRGVYRFRVKSLSQHFPSEATEPIEITVRGKWLCGVFTWEGPIPKFLFFTHGGLGEFSLYWGESGYEHLAKIITPSMLWCWLSIEVNSSSLCRLYWWSPKFIIVYYSTCTAHYVQL